MTTHQITGTNDGCQVAVSKLCSRLSPWIGDQLSGVENGPIRVGAVTWWALVVVVVNTSGEKMLPSRRKCPIWPSCAVKLLTRRMISRQNSSGPQSGHPKAGKHFTVTESDSGHIGLVKGILWRPRQSHGNTFQWGSSLVAVEWSGCRWSSEWTDQSSASLLTGAHTSQPTWWCLFGDPWEDSAWFRQMKNFINF